MGPAPQWRPADRGGRAGLLTALAAGPDHRRAAIRAELDEHLAPDGLLFEATPFAVPFLVELARNGGRPEEAFVALS